MRTNWWNQCAIHNSPKEFGNGDFTLKMRNLKTGPTIVNFGFVSEENSVMQINRLHHFEKFRVQNNVFCPQENEKLEFSISPRLNRVPKMQFS